MVSAGLLESGRRSNKDFQSFVYSDENSGEREKGNEGEVKDETDEDAIVSVDLLKELGIKYSVLKDKMCVTVIT